MTNFHCYLKMQVEIIQQYYLSDGFTVRLYYGTVFNSSIFKMVLNQMQKCL